MFFPENGHRWYIFKSLNVRKCYTFPSCLHTNLSEYRILRENFCFLITLWTFLHLLVFSPVLFWFTRHLFLVFGNVNMIWLMHGFNIPVQDLLDLMTQVFFSSFYFWTLFPLSPLKFSFLELRLHGLYRTQCVVKGLGDATHYVALPWPCLCFLAWIHPAYPGLGTWPRLDQSTAFSRNFLFNWN